MESLKLLLACILIILLSLINVDNELSAVRKNSSLGKSYCGNICDCVLIKFCSKIEDNSSVQRIVDLNSISNKELCEEFKYLSNSYGKFSLPKMLSSAKLSDTIIVNNSTGEPIGIPDWSKVYELKFEKPVPMHQIVKRLKKISIVDDVEKQVFGLPSLVPNDTKFIEGNKWAFEKIQAEKAWDITKGDSSITIAIIDFFGSKEENIIHEDLIGKVRKNFGQFGKHGRIVAGIAGANTNNYKGIASLGWDLKLNYYDASYPVKAILNAIEDSVEVINFSWVIRVDDPFIRDAVKTAIASGIVCVASAGNNEWKVPDTFYPAAYNFGEIGQVIAVSATELDGKNEFFVDGWNYCPECNPITDRTNSFIDVAAPGCDIQILSKDCCKSYENASGTSLAAPFVSALAGLLLSVDCSLSPNEIYNIITSTADKVGQYLYDENGWNRFLGYGRINAFNALISIQNKTKLVVDLPNINPSTIQLFQNYPNPFNNATNIEFENNEYQHIILKVYNILGEEIETIIDRKLNPGTYSYSFISKRSKTKYGSGIYLFRLETENCVKTIKGILIK